MTETAEATAATEQTGAEPASPSDSNPPTGSASSPNSNPEFSQSGPSGTSSSEGPAKNDSTTAPAASAQSRFVTPETEASELGQANDPSTTAPVSDSLTTTNTTMEDRTIDPTINTTFDDATSEKSNLDTPPKDAMLEDNMAEGTPMDTTSEGAKKSRAPRAPKAPAKPVEAGGSITTIVERVVRMTTLGEEHSAALGRLFNVSLPDDYVARLTRLTGASLGPIGASASEALTIVLGLESANPIHVGVQLGRLAPTSLPDVYRCAHALTGETAPALPKGDNAVFAVADVLATLTTEDFALAKVLSSVLE